MDWKVSYEKDKHFAVVKTNGDFNITDHARMIEDIVSSDFWKPGTDVLFDHRNLNFGFTNIELMTKASKNHQRKDDRIGDGKAAILMKSMSDYGRGRQFEMIADDKISARLKIFLREEDAVKWLSEADDSEQTGEEIISKK